MHFCYGDVNWRSPIVFAKSIAFQLGKRYPVYRKALIERNSAQKINIGVSLSNTTAQEVYGVYINNLNIDDSAEDVFNRLVWEPLKASFNEEHTGNIVVLVDALDEALLYTKNINIIFLLSQSRDIPKGVRFILTSRNDERILQQFPNAKVLRIDCPEFKDVNTKDITDYVNRRVDLDKKLAAKVTELKTEQFNNHVSTIIQKANGNFQYVSFLLDAIANDHQKFEEIKDLPVELDGLYHDYLEKFIVPYSDEWLGYYSAILGVLSIAEESLSEQQLRFFTGQSDLKLRTYLGRLQQFIERIESGKNMPDEKYRYRLYHQSFVDFFGNQFITKGNKRFDNKYYLRREEWHKKIVDYYQDLGAFQVDYIWSKMDSYGLLHLVSHLYSVRHEKINGTEEYLQKLYTLFNKSFMTEKLTRLGTPKPFAEDLSLAMDVARYEEPTNLLQIIRLILIHANLGNFAAEVPVNTLWILTLLGEESKALGYAVLMDERKKKSTFMTIGHALIRRGEISNAKEVFDLALNSSSREIFKQVSEIVGRRIECSLENDVSLLSSSMPYLIEIAEPNNIEPEENPIEPLGKPNELILRLASLYFIKLGKFDFALDLIKNNTKVIPGEILISIAAGLVNEGFLDKAITVTEKIEDWNHRARVNILCRIAEIYAGNNEKPKATNILDKAIEQTLAIENMNLADEIAYAFLSIAELSASWGDKERVIEIADQLISIANKLLSCSSSEGRIWDVLTLFSFAAQIFSLVGQRDRVLEISTYVFSEVDKILDSDMFSTVLEDDIITPMLAALVKSGESDKAIEEFMKVQERIGRSGTTDETILSELVLSIFEAGEVAKAFRTAELLNDKSDILVRVAKDLIDASKFSKALEIAREIDRKSSVAYVVENIADALKEGGKTNNLQHIKDEILYIAEHIEDEPISTLEKESPIAVALSAAAVMMVLTDNLPKAMELAKKSLDSLVNRKAISYEDVKADTLTAISQSLIEIGEFDKGLTVASTIPISIWKAHTLTAVTKSFLRLNQLDKASEVARMLVRISQTDRNSWNADILLEDAAVALNVVGEVDRAIETIDKMQKDFRKLEAMSRIIEDLSKLNEKSKAQRIIDVALKCVPKQAKRYSIIKTLDLLEATMLCSSTIGDANRLDQIIKITRKFILDHNITDSDWVDRPNEIPGAYGITDLPRGLKSKNSLIIFRALVNIENFEYAQEIQDEIQDLGYKGLSHLYMIEALSRSAKFDKAVTIAGNIEYDLIKAFALIEISEFMYSAGDISSGSRILQRGLSILHKKIKEKEDDFQSINPTGLLKGMINILSRLGKIDEAYSFANIFGQNYDRAEAIASIINEQTNTEQFPRALSLWRNELIRIHLTGAEYERQDMLRALGFSTPFLSSINDGKVLWDIYNAIVEIESWWGL